ncbi:hypothetical protein MRX96_039391 [Rhipicephalus microplus]
MRPMSTANGGPETLCRAHRASAAGKSVAPRSGGQRREKEEHAHQPTSSATLSGEPSKTFESSSPTVVLLDFAHSPRLTRDTPFHKFHKGQNGVPASYPVLCDEE